MNNPGINEDTETLLAERGYVNEDVIGVLSANYISSLKIKQLIEKVIGKMINKTTSVLEKDNILDILEGTSRLDTVFYMITCRV